VKVGMSRVRKGTVKMKEKMKKNLASSQTSTEESNSSTGNGSGGSSPASSTMKQKMKEKMKKNLASSQTSTEESNSSTGNGSAGSSPASSTMKSRIIKQRRKRTLQLKQGWKKIKVNRKKADAAKKKIAADIEKSELGKEGAEKDEEEKEIADKVKRIEKKNQETNLETAEDVAVFAKEVKETRVELEKKGRTAKNKQRYRESAMLMTKVENNLAFVLRQSTIYERSGRFNNEGIAVDKKGESKGGGGEVEEDYEAYFAGYGDVDDVNKSSEAQFDNRATGKIISGDEKEEDEKLTRYSDPFAAPIDDGDFIGDDVWDEMDEMVLSYTNEAFNVDLEPTY